VNLNDHTLKVAVLRVRADRTAAELAAARQDAERDFATARKAGIRQLTLVLPDGTEAGVLSIYKGPVDVAWDEEKLLQVIDSSTPRDAEDFLVPAALTEDRVVRLVREHFPEFTGRRVKPARLTELEEEVRDTGGKLLDLTTGEMVQVAAVTRREPTGKFAYSPSKKDIAAIQAALDAGVLTAGGTIAGRQDGAE
jgi:hypothetical protein